MRVKCHTLTNVHSLLPKAALEAAKKYNKPIITAAVKNIVDYYRATGVDKGPNTIGNVDYWKSFGFEIKDVGRSKRNA